jgi:hypothetical protein
MATPPSAIARATLLRAQRDSRTRDSVALEPRQRTRARLRNKYRLTKLVKAARDGNPLPPLRCGAVYHATRRSRVEPVICLDCASSLFLEQSRDRQ